jgi:hypothetical protein
MAEDEVDHITEASTAAREQAWAAWGNVEPDVLTHLINPSFQGGPRWPNLRQAYRVARRSPDTLVASDGLSDPFDPELFEEDAGPPRNGFELEVYAIGRGVAQVPGSWLFDAVWQMSQTAAANGRVAAMIEDLGFISAELNGVNVPAEFAKKFVTGDGCVGVLLGLNAAPIPASVEGPLSPIRLVHLKVLTVAELDVARARGAAGRSELARAFAARSDVLVSSLKRESIV